MRLPEHVRRKLERALQLRRVRPEHPSSSPPSHVRTCTPFVIDVIGTSSTGRSGQRSCHISRETAPWSFETPFAYADVSNANGVIPKSESSGCTLPRASNSSQEKPQRSTSGSTFRRTSPGSNTSLPAGTGVCVVKTVDARSRSSAASRSIPSPRPARAAARAGRTPSGPRSCGTRSARARAARSTRTPPMPSTSSCRSRFCRSPPYSVFVTSRAQSGLPSTFVSRR